jgi:class 3 adenylate cyclase
MADRNAEIPEDKRIAFRIGVNLGDVIAEEHDIFGDGVNVAARLEALAEPGGICVSRVVRDRCAKSCLTRSRTGVSKASRTLHDPCASMRCAPKAWSTLRYLACRSGHRVGGRLSLLL